MRLRKSDQITLAGLKKKDIGFGQSSKWKVVCLAKMHHISKNWECVFDFQYKVVTGQCDMYMVTYALEGTTSMQLSKGKKK